MLVSTTNDPALNLAFEHHLFQEAHLPCMLLYRNVPCVVIGRNQNPWLEANMDYLRAHNIQLLRRFSGGGTVYHDLGNTNYSYMMPRSQFDRDTTAQKLVTALQTAGIDVALNSRHDIILNTAEGWRKCSGSAYKISKDRAYAHGTMLLNSDIKNLGQALRAGEWGIKGNGVESVRSKVANLELGHDAFCDSVAKAFHMTPIYVNVNEMLTLPAVAKSMEQLLGSQWTFEQTPPFTQTVLHKDGQVVTVKVRRGRIESVEGEGVETVQFVGQDFVPSLLCNYLRADKCS